MKYPILPGSLVVAATLMAGCLALSAAEPAARGFQNRIFTDADGKAHKYVLFVPVKSEPGAKPPVILFLHGAGERGDNGLDQLMVGLGPAIWKRKPNFPFVVVIPQCEVGSSWQVESPDAQRALAMLKLAQAEFDTDPDRVYLTGLSMGGSGTWSIAMKDPAPWAAIVPMCARGDLTQAQKLADARLPVWNFCGDKDQAATVANSRDLQAALAKAGAGERARYTEYPGVGHNCWDNAYGTDEVYTWLLAHSRNHPKKQ